MIPPAKMLVYCVISPSGKRYFGITKTTLAKRWSGHVSAAKHRPDRRPILDAIRKYGGKNFTIETVAENVTEDEAKVLEVAFIELFQTTDRRFGYNLSPGGKYDGVTASKAAWAAINSTPETRATYIKKLSDGKKANDWTDYDNLTAAMLKWREDNPQQVAEIQKIRIAAWREWREENKEHADEIGTRSLIKAREAITANPEKFITALTAGIRKSFENPQRIENLRKQTTQQWASRTEKERQAVSKSISQTHRKNYATMPTEEKAAHDAQLAEARKNIDHDLRKRRQKESLIAYWTPERRAEKAEQMRLIHPKGKPIA